MAAAGPSLPVGTSGSAAIRTAAPDSVEAAAAASAAAASPRSERSAVWAKPVVSPRTTRMPAPRLRPVASSSTRPSSSRALDAGPVLGEDLREVAAARQRDGQGAFDDIVCDHITVPTTQ